MTKLFESQWKQAKTMLLEGRDISHNMDGTKSTTKRQMMETLLDNTRKALHLFEAATAGATNASNVAALNKVILPILRRVMPTVIANEIIGVQPMTGPVGQIHTLRVRYADTVPAAGGGISAGAEALSPFNIASYYSGNGNPSAPAAANTSALEGLGGNRISVQILKEIVEAKTSKLSARWTFESAQDAQAQQGIDIEAEILAALAQEIVAEIDQRILTSLLALPGTPTSTFDMTNVTGTPTFVGDVHAALAILINRQANLIGARTRRGAGNWLVVSPTALTILQSATTSAFARTTEGVFEAPTNTKYVGTLNNAMRVYVNQYAADATPVLVGYKGNEMDAAAFYCPYVPLTSSGTLVDPNTFEPVVSFQTRYGYVELTNSASSLGNAADYLGLVGINAAGISWM
jgi:hypothetical protein